MRYVLLCQMPSPDLYPADECYDYWIYDSIEDAAGDITEEDFAAYQDIEIVDLLSAGVYEELIYRIIITDLIDSLFYMEDM